MVLFYTGFCFNAIIQPDNVYARVFAQVVRLILFDCRRQTIVRLTDNWTAPAVGKA